MSDVIDIDHHRALACDRCGSVHYNLLKSKTIECSSCGHRIGRWSATPEEEAKMLPLKALRFANLEQARMELDKAELPMPMSIEDIKRFRGTLPYSPEPVGFKRIQRITLSDNLENLDIVKLLMVPDRFYGYISDAKDSRLIGVFERSK